MANEQNLRIPTSEEAREMQKLSVASRERNKLIREELAKEIWSILDTDPSKLHEIARGIVERSAQNSGDLSTMADIVDGKQKDRIEADINHIEIRVHNVE